MNSNIKEDIVKNKNNNARTNENRCLYDISRFIIEEDEEERAELERNGAASIESSSSNRKIFQNQALSENLKKRKRSLGLKDDDDISSDDDEEEISITNGIPVSNILEFDKYGLPVISGSMGSRDDDGYVIVAAKLITDSQTGETFVKDVRLPDDFNVIDWQKLRNMVLPLPVWMETKSSLNHLQKQQKRIQNYQSRGVWEENNEDDNNDDSSFNNQQQKKIIEETLNAQIAPTSRQNPAIGVAIARYLLSKFKLAQRQENGKKKRKTTDDMITFGNVEADDESLPTHSNNGGSANNQHQQQQQQKQIRSRILDKSLFNKFVTDNKELMIKVHDMSKMNGVPNQVLSTGSLEPIRRIMQADQIKEYRRLKELKKQNKEKSKKSKESKEYDVDNNQQDERDNDEEE